MKKVSTIKKRQKLSYKDFTDAPEGSYLHEILLIMNIHRYEFKVKRALYQTGIISAETFLFTDEIYRYLGYKDFEGNIIINDTVIEVLDRKLLAEEFHKKSSFLFSLLIELDDDFYEVLKENATNEEFDMGPNVSTAINNLVRENLDAVLMRDIEEDEALRTALQKKQKA